VSNPNSSSQPGLRPSLASPTIKVALLVGFGLTLGLWLFAGYRLTQRMGNVETEANAINARYVRAQELLSSVRARMLMGSVLVRDALLDNAAAGAGADAYRQRFEDTYRAAERALRQYTPVLDSPDELQGIARLRREMSDFRQEILAVLSTDRRQWPTQSRLLLQQRVMPRREVVLRISDQVQALNRSAFVAKSEATAAVYRNAQRDAWRQLGLALAASLAIGLWASVYSGRLEARLRRQRARDLQLTTDLHRLSAKLVSAQEDERRTIARELHDEVGQALAAIRVELAFAQRSGEEPATVAARLNDVRAITEGALHTIRDLSHLLHPAMLDELGLEPALESLLQGFGRRHGVEVELRHHGVRRRLGRDLETAVYRIVQEALNNIAKHAQAGTCRVRLETEDETVVLTVEDDGVGFVAPASGGGPAGGLGLIGIRERVMQFGGNLRVDSAPGRGTRLFVQLSNTSVAAPVSAGIAPPAESLGESWHGAVAHLPR
jgi:signal transduction histidine kinase